MSVSSVDGNLSRECHEPVTTHERGPDLQEPSDQDVDLYVRTANASFAPFEPRREVSRLSVGGGSVLSESEISTHPISELNEDQLQSLEGGEQGGSSDSGSENGGEPPKDAPPKPPRGWPDCKDYPRWYWRRLIGFDQSQDVFGFFLSIDLIFAFVFTCTTLVLFGIIEHYAFFPLINHTLHFFIPAFGASCTVIFGVPKAAIAQPRNVVIAHVSAAIIGVALTNALRSVKTHAPFGSHVAGAIGVALHLALMQLTNTMHPPASATVISAAGSELNAYYQDEGFLFVITPVLVGSLLCCVMASLLNNLVPSRGPYPQYW